MSSFDSVDFYHLLAAGFWACSTLTICMFCWSIHHIQTPISDPNDKPVKGISKPLAQDPSNCILQYPCRSGFPGVLVCIVCDRWLATLHTGGNALIDPAIVLGCAAQETTNLSPIKGTATARSRMQLTGCRRAHLWTLPKRISISVSLLDPL